MEPIEWWRVVLQWVGYAAAGFGLLGAVLPVLPGPMLIWLGTFLWSWGDRFRHLGWPSLLVLALLSILAAASDLWMSALGARRTGASWQALLAGMALGILGFVFLSLPGAIGGAILGVLLVEVYRSKDVQSGLKRSAGLLVGYLLAASVQITLSLVMIAIFVWQALGPP